MAAVHGRRYASAYRGTIPLHEPACKRGALELLAAALMLGLFRGLVLYELALAIASWHGLFSYFPVSCPIFPFINNAPLSRGTEVMTRRPAVSALHMRHYHGHDEPPDWRPDRYPCPKEHHIVPPTSFVD